MTPVSPRATTYFRLRGHTRRRWRGWTRGTLWIRGERWIVLFLCRAFLRICHTTYPPTPVTTASTTRPPTTVTTSSTNRHGTVYTFCGGKVEELVISTGMKILHCVECAALMANVKEYTMQHNNAGRGHFDDRIIGKKEVTGYYYGSVFFEDWWRTIKNGRRGGEMVVTVTDFEKW